MSYISLKKAVAATGLHPNTLRKYADNGTVPHYRSPNGDRYFDVSCLVGASRAVICYARVSTTKQKEDLKRQAAFLRERYPEAEIIEDIGSGLNFKRKGLLALLERAMRGERLQVIVSYRDRLARFGFDLVKWAIERSGGEVLVLNQIDTSPTAELISDLMAIITVFSSRLHGLRSYKRSIKGDFAETVEGSGSDAAELGGELPESIQSDS